jgi:thiopeptide-type bacteriocin biosynthesis protein
MIRASAIDPSALAALSWPSDSEVTDMAALRRFIETAWGVEGLADAVALASPSLALAVAAILRGDELSLGSVIRAAMAMARYVIRARGRATPFGLLAGAVPAEAGGDAGDPWRRAHQLAARADGQWLAAVVARLEGCAELLRRLHVTANDLVAVRGDRIIVSWLPHGSQAARMTPVEVSLRRTPPAEAALRLALSPVKVADLRARLTADFAPVAASRVDTMIRELASCGVLITSLRPPSTSTDGLAHVLAALDAVGADGLPSIGALVAALRDVHSRVRQASVADLPGGAGRMRVLAEAPAHPVAVDLRLSHQVTVPGEVAAEAAGAAGALARLGNHQHGPVGWLDYHARFLERYGVGAIVMAQDVADPVTGLGLPGHYARPPEGAQGHPWTGRDERLATLAQRAALDGAMEVVLDDDGIERLAGPWPSSAHPAPHGDITIELRAASLLAVGAGDLMIVVRGTGRTAIATSGRFLHLLSDDERERLACSYRDLPSGTRGAMLAQLSFPPRHPRVENVTRVPQVLPYLLSVAEFQGSEPGRVALSDLAVTADLDRFYLLSLTRRAVVEPVLACAPAWHAVPPMARLLFELPRVGCAVPGLFDWGAAAGLPFLPRLRYGRAVLSPARWRVQASELPGPAASGSDWTAAVSGLRRRLELPDWVSVGKGDRQLRLDLDHAMDLAVFRDWLSADGACVVTESWAPADHGWCGGRAHEIVIPLASTAPPVASPKALARRWPLPVVGRDHGHPPGSAVLSARLYSDPRLFDLILTRHLPDLADGWPGLSYWWFLRYRDRDSSDHLRLRFHVPDYGRAASRTGCWAADLRRRGLAGDLLLDTYRPEAARFGSGTAMSAAERLFAADSAAALAQLAATGPANPEALTAASLADLASSVLGGQEAGFEWLACHPAPGNAGPMNRSARLAALAMTRPGPTASDVVPAAVRLAWLARADAAGHYAKQVAEQATDPTTTVESLLHLHHNRVHGSSPAGEARTYRLARAAALGHMARRNATAGSQP